MKNILRAFAFLALTAMFFASCKSYEKCPAYGQQTKPATQKDIRG